MNTVDLERFWNKVDKTSSPLGCWEWKNPSHPFGYGRFGQELAHRISYNLHNPPLGPGQCVLHQCDNPRCVNPAHLTAGSRSDNARERTQRDRTVKGSQVVNSILTELQVIEIRYSSKSVRELSALYGVGESNIYAIKSRSIWKHI
jgi:hypothetical protein